MEVRVREKTLMGMFLKYMVAFCINTVLVFVTALMVLVLLTNSGQILPANYAEQWLNDHTETIRTVEKVSEIKFPEDCEYGVYTREGGWLYGTIAGNERTKVWEGYQKKNMSALEGYFRFVPRKNEELCIVKYHLRMRYASESWNHFLPNPELLLLLLTLILFIIQAVLLARRFSRSLKKRLNQLNEVTQKISENNLEFDVPRSDLKEIGAVLLSLGHMKDALQASLKKQWDMEAEQNRQVRALVHDIKTPLTIIRGNAELMGEDAEHLTEYQKQILKNAGEMERYLEKMRLILRHQVIAEQEICISCSRLQMQLKEQAQQMTLVKELPLMIQCSSPQGVIQVNPEQLKRAWENVLNNAMEYTDAEQGVDVFISEVKKDETYYLTAQVSDYGPGFTGEELKHATEEFYRGDESRHDRSHQGLGLSITKRVVEAQGGFLEIGNSKKTGGGQVTLWLAVERGQKL